MTVLYQRSHVLLLLTQCVSVVTSKEWVVLRHATSAMYALSWGSLPYVVKRKVLTVCKRPRQKLSFAMPE